MNYFNFNILFITLIIINLNFVLNSNKIKQQHSDNCSEYSDNKENLIKQTLENSKNINSTFFLFFSSKFLIYSR